jgi:alpha/beta superfamily hydrolase
MALRRIIRSRSWRKADRASEAAKWGGGLTTKATSGPAEQDGEERRVIVELVRTKTLDGVRLDGALQRASVSAARAATIHGAICLHGVGGNFYSSTLMEQLAQTLLAQGVSVLRVNTRGHDGVSTASTDAGGIQLGAAYEIVDDCCHDVEAWIRFLLDCGSTRIALLGHSLGAIKAIYAQALQPHEAIERIIAISPPRLAYSRFVKGHQATEFEQSLVTARQRIEADQPRSLFEASFPFPLILSAATFCDKYGPEERYNFLNLANALRIPVNFVFGQAELDTGTSAFEGLVDDIHSTRWAAEYSVDIIPAADHFYKGRVDELAEAVTRRIGCRNES